MCWMLVKQAGKQVNFEYMDKAQKHNEDGYGVSWYEDGHVKTYKTFNYNQFKGIVAALKHHTLVAHLRYATKGAKNFNNIHPFDIPSGVMFHNGTMAGLGNYKKSDSQELADTLLDCEYKFIEDIAPLVKPYIDDKINRLVFFEDNGRVTIMNESLGINEDGAWYSNDYHLKDEGWCRAGCKPKTTPKTTPKDDSRKDYVMVRGDEITPDGVKRVATTMYYVHKSKVKTSMYDKPSMDDKPSSNPVIPSTKKKHKVFVYGTLKRGYSNHNRILTNATFLGKAQTTGKWNMIGKDRAFPYLIEKDAYNGHRVRGEVFYVNDAEMAQLDALEGISFNHYKKSQINIQYDGDYTLDTVNVYLMGTPPVGYKASQEMIAEWSN